jgi:hypothetical protein
MTWKCIIILISFINVYSSKEEESFENELKITNEFKNIQILLINFGYQNNSRKLSWNNQYWDFNYKKNQSNSSNKWKYNDLSSDFSFIIS